MAYFTHFSDQKYPKLPGVSTLKGTLIGFCTITDMVYIRYSLNDRLKLEPNMTEHKKQEASDYHIFPFIVVTYFTKSLLFNISLFL